MSDTSGESGHLSFIQFGDAWVRADTIQAVEVEWQRSTKVDEKYQVKARSTAFATARVYGTYSGKREAERAAQDLLTLVVGVASGGSSPHG